MRSLVLILILFSSALANNFLIRLIARDKATVTKPIITLSDIAEVEEMQVGQDDLVIGIKKVQIGTAPKAGETVELQASSILDALRDQGINLREVGYSIPKSIKVTRAGREITINEVREAIESYFQEQGKEATLKKISSLEGIKVPPGNITLEPIFTGRKRDGNSSFDISFSQNGVEIGKFPVVAKIDEYNLVPIASRKVERGEIIDEGSVEMARVNLSELTGEFITDESEILGKQARSRIDSGTPFRKMYVERAIAVEKGKKVILHFSSRAFEATATGIALDSRGINEGVKVRNDSSGKIVSGVVTGQGIVKVN